MESPFGNVVQRASKMQSYPLVDQQENGDPSINSLDDADIKITIIAESTTPKPTCDPTTIKATSDIAKINSLKRELYKFAIQDMWDNAKPIYDKANEMIRIPLTARGDTALHVAVSANSTTFVEEWVKVANPEDLEILNKDGNTAFCVAAITGHGDFFKIMIQRNEKLPKIIGQNELLPVHLAVLYGNKKFVEDLTSKKLLENLNKEDIEKLFFMTINNNMYDVAIKLLDDYSNDLIVAKYGAGDKKMTALHLLMQMKKPPVLSRNSHKETSSGCGGQMELLKLLWCHIIDKLEHKDIVEMITCPSMVLFDAVKSGNDEAVKWLLSINPELVLTMKDPVNGRNIMHIAALYKQHSILYFILEMDSKVLNTIIRDVDNEGNNILHLVSYQPQEESSTLTPDEQMLTEFRRFKEVEKRVPWELRTMINKDGKRPIDILNANQEKLCKEVMKLTTKNANICIVVAVLVASMAIESALNVSDKKFDFMYASFIVQNGFALMLSTTSIVDFLTLFMRSSLASKSVRSAQLILTMGQLCLFGSIIVMISAFTTASILLFNSIKDKPLQSYKYVMVILAVVPIGMSCGILTALYKKIFKVKIFKVFDVKVLPFKK